ncbi:hypothetical protein GCM10011529_18720 [Polymorphobacter glacialis]|uniref:Uncharacterized protein n=1 Tax=Sandarakinorhabdus glacialis TaxID=1614636 RepID=A0A917E846_9SPHN|nr:hypothetical protein [Polymorphobacter glacialis]GGE12593.1 hypothetical protein GCM10011529_18720 [Polymorphobacter glacialis]
MPAFGAQTAPQPPFVITAAPGKQPHIPVRLKQSTLDIRLALSFDSALILNTEPAQRAGLKPFPLIGKRTFKSALIPGGEATFRGNLFGVTPQGLKKSTLPVIWVDRPIAADAEGVLALSVLKADRIIVELGPQAANSKVYTLTRKGKGDAGLKARIGDENIDVALELNSPDTVMNGRAAAALVAAGLMKRNGLVGFWKPFPGVALPFERMTPAPGATLLGLPMSKPGVRITEIQAQALDAQAKAGTSTVEDDDDTITVTASRKKGRNPWILLGGDVLSHCSRIEFDRPGKAWHLTCAFGT